MASIINDNRQPIENVHWVGHYLIYKGSLVYNILLVILVIYNILVMIAIVLVVNFE